MEISLRDEDVQAIILGLATHRECLEGVAQRVAERSLSNQPARQNQDSLTEHNSASTSSQSLSQTEGTSNQGILFY